MLRFSRVLGILALAAAFGAAPAQAGFAPSSEPIGSGEQLGVSGLAMDAAGNSIVTWSESGASIEERVAKARRVAADGSSGQVIDLAPGEDAFRPAVAMTADGRAFAAWRWEPVGSEQEGVRGRWIEANGALGPVLTLIEPDPVNVDAVEVLVVIDPAGIATVGWKNQKGSKLELRRVRPDGALDPLVADVSGGVSDPQIGALPNGGTVAVWRGGGIEKNVVDAAGNVGTVETISVASGIEAAPGLAVDSLGNGLVAWRLHETTLPETFSIRARRLDANGAPIGEELLIDAPQEPFVNVEISVTSNSGSAFLVHWVRQDGEGNELAYGRSLNAAAESLAPTQPLTDPADDVSTPRTALFDAGPAAALWGGENAGVRATQGREFSFPGLTGGPLIPLSNQSGTNLSASAPAIGAAAFVIDYPISGSAHAAELRRFLLPPTCTDSSEALTRDATVAIPLPCTGPAIEGAQILTSPRHGSLGAYDPATGSIAYTPTAISTRNDSFSYAALNDGGSSNPVTVTIRDRVRPRLFSLRLLRTKKRPRVFRVRIGASEPVKPRLVLQRRLPGVLKGKRCKKPRSRAQLRNGVRCLRFHKIGVVQKKGYSRRWRIRVPRKFQRALRHGGGFRIKAQGVDRARNKSRVKRINLRT
jgi:hypothetical protein